MRSSPAVLIRYYTNTVLQSASMAEELKETFSLEVACQTMVAGLKAEHYLLFSEERALKPWLGQPPKKQARFDAQLLRMSEAARRSLFALAQSAQTDPEITLTAIRRLEWPDTFDGSLVRSVENLAIGTLWLNLLKNPADILLRLEAVINDAANSQRKQSRLAILLNYVQLARQLTEILGDSLTPEISERDQPWNGRNLLRLAKDFYLMSQFMRIETKGR